MPGWVPWGQSCVTQHLGVRSQPAPLPPPCYLGIFALGLQGLGGVRKGFWFIEFRPQICWLCRVNSTLSTKGH